MKVKKYNWILCYFFFLFFVIFIFSSCVEDVIELIKELIWYIVNDIKLYFDLFDVFWNIMN